MGRVATQSGFLTASLPAQSSEAISTAHPLSRIVAASDSRPSGQSSTGLPTETHFQDEKTILDDQRPARGANSDGSFHEASTRSGDGDGLAPGMEGVVDEQGKSVSGKTVSDLSFPFRSMANSSRIAGSFRNCPRPIDEDALSATLRQLGAAPALDAGANQSFTANTPAIAPELPLPQAVEPEEDSEGENEGQFRLELEFIRQKRGVVVKIRERVRFSVNGERPSFVLGVFACGNINNRQFAALKNKTLPLGVKTALAEGDISYEVLEGIFNRPGKGASAEGRAAGKRFRQAQAKHDG